VYPVRGGPAPPEIAEIRERFAGRGLEDGPRLRPLEGNGRDLLRDVLDVDVQPRRVHPEPPDLGIRSGPPERPIIQAMHRSVVDDLAVLVAPRGVEHAARRQLRRVAGDHPVDEATRVGPTNDVLVERADVDQGRCLADRVVLDVVGVGVGRGGEVAGPLAPLLLPVERGGDGVKGGTDTHGRDDLG
jgi:hypothetical protein